MSIVELIASADAPLLARPYYADGEPDPIVRALAHVPEMLEVAVPFIGAVLGPSNIDFRTKELVILRTSARLACRYCVDAHTPLALDRGVTRPEVEALRATDRSSEVFGDQRERALLDWVDAITGGSGPVDPEVTASMLSSFADHEIVELTLVAGTTMLLNRFCTALDLPTSPETRARLATEGFE